MEIRDENIVDSDAMFIAHQCNTVTTGAAGAAQSIFERWPAANDYARGTHGAFGTVKMYKVEQEKFVINMFAQQQPSHANSEKGDGKYARAEAFKKCLRQIAATVSDVCFEQGINRPVITFPYMIGCGLAGGDWEMYKEILDLFEVDFKKTCNGSVILSRYIP